MRALLHVATACAALLASGCAEPLPEATPARRDFMQFRREVYPVLLRDCGFAACHGAAERFFRVYGPGRVRLPLETGLPDALEDPTGDEVFVSYGLAQSMIDPAHPELSALLRKPLAVEAGGSGHFGVDKYGRDIYRTAQDSGYIALARWVFSPPPEPAGQTQ